MPTTQEQAYMLALNRNIGGVMPHNLYEQSARPKQIKRRGKKKAAKKSRKEWVANCKSLTRARNKRYYNKKKLESQIDKLFGI